MAKKSIVARNGKRKVLYERYKKVREDFRNNIAKAKLDPTKQREVFGFMLKLDALPKNSSKCRIRNRCIDTGRARGLTMYKLFGMCSFKLREHANSGFLPGVYKC